MWKHHAQEKEPVNKVKTLESIVRMQPFLSAYYDSTRHVMMDRLKIDIVKQPVIHVTEIKENEKDDRNPLSLSEFREGEQEQGQYQIHFTDQEREQIRRYTPLS